MKLEIEISEEDAACIWANSWKTEKPMSELVGQLAQTEAGHFRRAFPGAVKQAVEDFKAKDRLIAHET